MSSEDFDPPIILVSSGGELDIYPSVEGMQGNVESVDVEAGEWSGALDAEGRELELGIGGPSRISRFRVRDKGVTVSLVAGTSPNDARLRKTLVDALRRLGPETRGGRTLGGRLESLDDKSTDELLEMAVAVFTA